MNDFNKSTWFQGLFLFIVAAGFSIISVILLPPPAKTSIGEIREYDKFVNNNNNFAYSYTIIRNISLFKRSYESADLIHYTNRSESKNYDEEFILSIHGNYGYAAFFKKNVILIIPDEEDTNDKCLLSAKDGRLPHTFVSQSKTIHFSPLKTVMTVICIKEQPISSFKVNGLFKINSNGNFYFLPENNSDCISIKNMKC